MPIELKDLKTLSTEQYRAFEDVVGPEYISIDDNILEGYCFAWALELGWGGKFATRPLGVVMPSTTEEVQAIVKLCNRFNIPFKAHTSGFGPSGMSAEIQFLSIDLRRMNRIIEIDEKNMFVVFEPYTPFGALTNQCIKKGVRPYNIGAGPSANPMANATNVQGHGTVNCSAGWGGRVPLALEWVMPDGELMKMGSLGTSGQWFSGDGPGPSLRGIFRGITGPMGSLGVFTKLAIKLVSWFGPPKVNFYGDPPNYVAEFPKGLHVITVVFPTRKAMIDSMLALSEEKIAYWSSRRGPFTNAAAMTKSNKEVLEVWQTEEFQKNLAEFNHNISIGLDYATEREAEFKLNALMKIVERNGGREYEDTLNGKTAKFVHAYNGLGAVKGTFRSTGSLNSNPSCEEAIDAVSDACDFGVEVKRKYEKMGYMLADGDATWFTMEEDCCGHMEVPTRYDPCNPAAAKNSAEYLMETNRMITDKNLGIGEFECGYYWGSGLHAYAGPRNLNYHKWVGKIKTMLDPQNVGEGTRFPDPVPLDEKINM